MKKVTIDRFPDDYNPDDMSAAEEKMRRNLIECLARLKDKSNTCMEKARIMGQERLMVEMTSVSSKTEGLIRRMQSGLYHHNYRLDSPRKYDLERLHRCDRDLESLVSECVELIGNDYERKKYTKVIAKLRTIENIFKHRMSIIRIMRVYG